MKKTSSKLIIIISAIVVLCGLISIFAISNKSKTTVVGFYDIPQECQQAYQDIIIENNSNKIKFVTLTEQQVQKSSLPKKVQVLITYNGAITQKFGPKAVALSDDIKSRFPNTIGRSDLYNFDDNFKIFPINFDIYESMVLTTAVNHYNLPVPITLDQIDDFAKAAMEIYPIPIIFSGADDFALNSFFSQVVQAVSGAAGYDKLRNQLTEQKDFTNFYNYKLADANKGPITVATVLDLIKHWEEKDYINQKWRTTTAATTAQLIEDNRVAMAMMNLSEHRAVQSDNLNYYEKIIFPPASADLTDFHSIQPAIVGMIFKNTEPTRIIANRLTTTTTQELLSLVTKLGPATSQGTSIDRQADDARFFAASYPSGPAPDLATMAFSDKARQHEMAELIREY